MESANEILDNLNARIKRTLKQKGLEQKDGMDLVLISIDTETFEIEFAGAYNPIYIVGKAEETPGKANNPTTKVKKINKNGYELTRYKGDRIPIEKSYIGDKLFAKYTIYLKKWRYNLHVIRWLC